MTEHSLVRLSSTFARTRQVIQRLLRLTVETVGLPSFVGLVMTLLFFAHQSQSDAFFFLLEIRLVLFALSIMFTLNLRADLQAILARVPSNDATTQKRCQKREPEAQLTIVDGPDGQLVAQLRRPVQIQSHSIESCLLMPASVSQRLADGFSMSELSSPASPPSRSATAARKGSP